MTKKTALQVRGEDAAAAYLERVGMTVVDRDWQCEAGSIDIVALDGATIVVIDVDTREGGGTATGEGVSAAAGSRITRLAEAYIQAAVLQDVTWRYDRVSLLLLGDNRALLRHHRDALGSAV
jgi:putative endonuclease